MLCSGTEALKHSLEKLASGSNVVAALLDIAHRQGITLYLVGGFIRDTLLGRSSKDVDLASTGARDLARLLVEQTGARVVPIDARFGTMRLIPAAGAVAPVVSTDLSPLRGTGIEDDLRKRDFTVNALGVDLAAWYRTGRLEVIDPLEGLRDLANGLLRACTRHSPAEDPLRLLRGYRLVATRGFTLDPETRALGAELHRELGQVAVERLRDELVLILSAPHAAAIVRRLDADGLLRPVLPECEPLRGMGQNHYHHHDVWEHSLFALESLEYFLGAPHRLVGAHAEEALAVIDKPVARERIRRCLLKLAALIHDIGKPATRTVDEKGTVHFYGHEVVGARTAARLCSRLRFSTSEVRFVSELVRHHMRPIHLAHIGRPSPRALSRFFRLGPGLFWPLLFLFGADCRATRAPNAARTVGHWLHQQLAGWLDFYVQQVQPREGEPLMVDGRDLMRHLGLDSGPTVGRLLDVLAELQWEGRLSSREEALRQAEELLRDWRGKDGTP
jgi:putative nucleotidyltransferase with HDIG domain